MICCLVGLLILTVVGRVRRVVGLGGDPAPLVFAPVACRPAAGEAPRELIDQRPGADAGPPPVSVLRYAALAVAACLVGIPLLAICGAVENTGSAAAWLLRSVCYLAVIVAASVLTRSMPIWRAPRGVGAVLIVAGAVVFETGVLDMHVFRIIEIENLTGDMVFHNVGPALAVIGGLVLLYGAAGRRTTSRRLSRSTVTSAWPSSSAVTVSSPPSVGTPPLTM